MPLSERSDCASLPVKEPRAPCNLERRQSRTRQCCGFSALSGRHPAAFLTSWVHRARPRKRSLLTRGLGQMPQMRANEVYVRAQRIKLLGVRAWHLDRNDGALDLSQLIEQLG